MARVRVGEYVASNKLPGPGTIVMGVKDYDTGLLFHEWVHFDQHRRLGFEPWEMKTPSEFEQARGKATDLEEFFRYYEPEVWFIKETGVDRPWNLRDVFFELEAHYYDARLMEEGVFRWDETVLKDRRGYIEQAERLMQDELLRPERRAYYQKLLELYRQSSR